MRIVLSSTLEERAQKKKVKKGQKRSKGKALGGVLGPHPPPYLAIFFFFQLGTNGRSKREKEAYGQ
jgi:hypothetical protein